MAENIEMDDLEEERQEERDDRMDDGEEETSFYHEQDNTLEDFSDNVSQYEGNLPDLPSISHERPELEKNNALQTFIKREIKQKL